MPADNFLWFPSAATGGLLTQAGYNADKPKGETTDAYFVKQNALEVLSFSFGVSQAETTGSASTGAGAGKAKFEEFSIEKAVDLASVPLYVACAAGAHFPTVNLAIRKAGGSQLLYLQYIFRMVFVTNISWSGGGGDEAPKETVKFKFGAMGIQYLQQTSTGAVDPKGKMIGWWSTTSNQPTYKVAGLSDTPTFLEGQPTA
jgi:type VI secretion system secreted protein Hcp